MEGTLVVGETLVVDGNLVGEVEGGEGKSCDYSFLSIMFERCHTPYWE